MGGNAKNMRENMIIILQSVIVRIDAHKEKSELCYQSWEIWALW